MHVSHTLVCLDTYIYFPCILSFWWLDLSRSMLEIIQNNGKVFQANWKGNWKLKKPIISIPNPNRKVLESAVRIPKPRIIFISQLMLMAEMNFNCRLNKIVHLKWHQCILLVNIIEKLFKMLWHKIWLQVQHKRDLSLCINMYILQLLLINKHIVCHFQT